MTRRGWLGFTAMSLIWGVPYLLIRIAVRHGVTAPALAWARVTLAAVVLLALAWRAGALGGLRGRWRWLVGYAVAEIAVPFPMLGAGEEHVSSSLAAILIASVPLIGAVLALRLDHAERPGDCLGAADARGRAGPAALGPRRRRDRRRRRARPPLHGGGVRDLHGTDPGGGQQPRDRDHLHQSADRGRARGRAAGRAAGSGRRGRAAVDPGRIVAGDAAREARRS